jgi:hypothetical protein
MFGQKYDPQKAKEQKEKRAANDGTPWIKRFPKNETQFRFRPMVEIDDFVTYFEVYDQNIRRGWPLTPEQAETFVAEDGQDVKRKPLLPVVALKEDKSWAWACPWAVIDYLTAHSELKGTITDMDFICVKSGSGLDTEYNVVADERVARDLSKYDAIDSEAVLVNAYQHAVEEGYVDGEAPKTQSTPEPESAPETAQESAQEAPAPDPEPEPAEDAPTTGTDRSAGLEEGWQDHTIAKLRKYARDRKINPSGMNRQEIVDAITGADAL